MAAVIQLGSFERCALTEAWPTEDGNFTPWLAQDTNIRLLGDVLGIELEVEAVEHWVGAFRADILARARLEDEARVIVENQFGRTDHRHLGQLLTYLAGIEGARTVVWIAETIQSDHRAAVDWLNEHTADEFSFFAIEIELWRIGSSTPAPRFNVVASPNDWARSARSAARQLREAPQSGRGAAYQAYWSAFSQYLANAKTRFRLQTPPKDYWYNFSIGRAGFSVAALAAMRDKWNGVELNISHAQAKSAFDQLYANREAIEAQCEVRFEWLRLDAQKSSKITLVNREFDPNNAEQWPEQHAWLLDGLQRLDKFAPWVAKLQLSAPELKTIPGSTNATEG